jgi:hypothetical protein
LLISDGQVEQPTNCVALAIKNRTNHWIFTVGIGDSISAEFIREISECTQGTAKFISSGTDVYSTVME